MSPNAVNNNNNKTRLKEIIAVLETCKGRTLNKIIFIEMLLDSVKIFDIMKIRLNQK